MWDQVRRWHSAGSKQVSLDRTAGRSHLCSAYVDKPRCGHPNGNLTSGFVSVSLSAVTPSLLVSCGGFVPQATNEKKKDNGPSQMVTAKHGHECWGWRNVDRHKTDDGVGVRERRNEAREKQI